MKRGILISVMFVFFVIPGILFGQSLNFPKTQVTTGSVTDETPAWSPNSEKIVFASQRSGNYDIWVINTNGTGLTQLTSSGLDEKYPSWNPAGTQIAYIVRDPNAGEWGGGYFLYTMNADGSGKSVHPLPPGDGQEPTDAFWNFETRYTAWSPDGTSIAFVSYGPNGGYNKIYLYNLTNNQVSEITPAGEANPGGMIFNISWCWATNLLAFDRYPIGVQTFTPGSSDLQVLNIPRQNQFDTPTTPGWNPAGTKIAYVKNLFQTSAIAIFEPATGTNIVEATPSNLKWPAWSPDGNKIAVSDGNIWVLTIPHQPLYAYFSGNGLYTWDDTTWTRIATSQPLSMAAAGSTLYATFSGVNGIFKWDGASWTRIGETAPASFTASGSTLYAYFSGYGLYTWDGTTWTQIGTSQPLSITASGSALYATFSGVDGIYKYDSSTWTKFGDTAPAMIAAAGSTLYAYFTGYGLYTWNGTTWTQIGTSQPLNIVTSGSALYATFSGVNGIYKFDGSAWTKLGDTAPTAITATGTTLYGYYMGYGLYSWNGTTWTQLGTSQPESMVSGD